MRCIKFRAKDVFTGKLVYGDLVHNKKVTKTGLEDRIMVGGYEVFEDSIGQFTGQHYADGEPVYEKDCVQREIGNESAIGRVRWNNQKACFEIRYHLSGLVFCTEITKDWKKIE